ncbi:photosystem II reaction center protein Psb28 [Leptolyngbya sp. FACHB-36]|uniref:photosystem II reaction center protein Psb28 n=1 Tax=Leptolyngbya sp. FACHB-36 TaxID=2692808 RepID=UPI001680B504|nr:photosystem II reaction center protein Psb28 [Leptolyngbya sp. FACHB-36]MBD2021630.1 photosystem II reaction center protein Psb28 [Leptolyngbya sp. FACHB-36]
MTVLTPRIQFFDGIPEALSDVSLRRNRQSGLRTVLMTFTELRSIERFNSFRNRFSRGLKLIDTEGEISVEPSSVKFFFSGPEGDEFERMECRFEIDRDDHWERFMRFMNRYAEANGMEYGESSSVQP